MSSNGKDVRLAELLVKADAAIKGDEQAKAATILREASQLDGENVEVKKRWLQLQSNDAGSEHAALESIRHYVASRADGDGKKASQALKERQMSFSDAAAAYDLTTRAPKSLSLVDEIAGLLLSRHNEVRKLVVAELINQPTTVFEQLYGIGDETFRAFIAIVLDATLWSAINVQATAQQDIFRLCVATLIEAGVDRPERAMRAIARQLAVAPQNVSSLIDEDILAIVLTDLDIRLENSLRSQALLSTSRILEATKEEGEALFAKFVTSKVAKQTNDDLIQAFSVAAAGFPILPAVAAKLFLTEGFVQQLVPNLEKNSEAAAAGKRKSLTLEQAALELLSAACVSKECREAVSRHCEHWLKALSEERNGVHKALASLVLAKISESSVDDVTGKLTQLVINGDEEKDQAIEGLAYTSLQPKVKEELVKDASLLESLVAALKDRPTAAFGCLTVFSNLSIYRPTLSDEQKRMTQLKAYANSSKLPPEDPLENDRHVTARCKKLLEAGVVPSLVAACKQSTSPTNIALAVRILLSLTKEQKHRSKMAQQGAVKLLLQIRERVAKTDKSTGDAALIERSASHALARLLISVNPEHVFSSSLLASSAVSALVPLLRAEGGADGEGEGRDLLPTFEALLALTNLASMDDAAARDLLIRKSFEHVENLLFSSHTLIQRASVELVCNLMASPICVSLFANGTADAQRGLLILLALTDVEDLATRRAAGGALAMLTEWDVAVTAVLDVQGEKGVRRVLGMCGDESLEVKHRGLVCAVNMLGAPGATGERGMRDLKAVGGLESVRKGLQGVKEPSVLGIGVEVLKKLGG